MIALHHPYLLRKRIKLSLQYDSESYEWVLHKIYIFQIWLQYLISGMLSAQSETSSTEHVITLYEGSFSSRRSIINADFEFSYFELLVAWLL